MDVGETLYVTDREEWRKWLEKYFDRKDEIWLIFPNKSSALDRIPYNDAVEEALCFGWIDSIIKSLDENRSVQRFSPRRSKSSYSQPNKERLAWLLNEEKIHPSIRAAAEEAVKEKFMFPPDIIEAIKSNRAAWTNYRKFSPAYQRIRVAYIDSARSRPEEFDKRLVSFIKNCEQNKQVGFGGIEKYY
ncbi:YdeI family protein [Acidobacteriota bacterium]